MHAIGNPKDFFLGVLLVIVAAVFALGLTKLRIGTAAQMGPGYFPMLLICLLGILGAALVVKGLRKSGTSAGTIDISSIRGLALIVLPVAFVGATLKPLGMVPSLGIAVLLTTFAAPDWTVRNSIAITIAVVAFCWLVFSFGLGLPVSAFGPLMGGR